MRADELLNFLIKHTLGQSHNLGRNTFEVDEKDDLDTASEDL